MTEHSIPAGPPLVLIVEDEPLLRMLAGDIIEDAGFEACYAADADEAIALLETRPDIRIVFTDIDMPGSMNGLKLASAVRNRWPPVGIIITSGKVRPLDNELPAAGVFMAKPYAPQKLMDQLHRMAA